MQLLPTYNMSSVEEERPGDPLPSAAAGAPPRLPQPPLAAGAPPRPALKQGEGVEGEEEAAVYVAVPLGPAGPPPTRFPMGGTLGCSVDLVLVDAGVLPRGQRVPRASAAVRRDRLGSRLVDAAPSLPSPRR